MKVVIFRPEGEAIIATVKAQSLLSTGAGTPTKPVAPTSGWFDKGRTRRAHACVHCLANKAENSVR